MKYEFVRFLRGFGYAGSGILRAVREERNFRFHLCFGCYVVFIAARFYQFSAVEWAILTFCLAGVPAMELMNSAVERAVQDPDAAHWAAAGAAKDLAAGAVLVSALGAVAVGVCLFWQPAVFGRVIKWLWTAWYRPVLLGFSLLAAGGFVFAPRK